MNEMECRAAIAEGARAPEWWRRAANVARSRGHVLFIGGRTDPSVYLVRLWLAPPFTKDGDLESGDQLMLHWIVRPDDEGALHDHPWDFETEVLSGGYTEQTVLGDRELKVGDRVKHHAEDLHRISSALPDTWTLFRTGPSVRKWGFVPDGGEWVYHRDYITRLQAEGRR